MKFEAFPKIDWVSFEGGPEKPVRETPLNLLAGLCFLPLVQKQIGTYQCGWWVIYHCGFLPGKSVIDQILNLRHILERTIEYGIGTFHLIIEFEATYDSINR